MKNLAFYEKPSSCYDKTDCFPICKDFINAFGINKLNIFKKYKVDNGKEINNNMANLF